MNHNLIFLAFLYFVQGLPYGLQTWFLPVFFRSQGMSLSNVGFFKFLLIPWMLKALWAPFVDRYGTKKSWLVWSMTGLTITCLIGSFCSPTVLPPLAAILFLFNLLTSTQDIAVDGFAIQILSSSELGKGNSAQVVGYKIGGVVGGGLLTWLSDYLDWMTLFQCLALVYLIAVFIAYKFIPTVPQHSTELIIEPGGRSPDEGSSESIINQADGYDDRTEDEGIVSWLIKHFKLLLKTEGTLWIALYVILYKLGEKGSLSMIPMFLLDQGISPSRVGFWTGMVGQFVSIIGSLLGGIMMSTFGHSTLNLLKKLSMVRTVVLVVVSVIIYTWSPGNQTASTVVVIGLMLVMLLISGYITTATFTLMMECSQRAPPTVQASHYTTLATLEVLGKLTFSIAIGWITDMTSYSVVFVLFPFLSAAIIPVFKYAPSILVQSSMHGRNKNH